MAEGVEPLPIAIEDGTDEFGVAAPDNGEDVPVEVCLPAGGDCIGLIRFEPPFVATAVGFLPHAEAGIFALVDLGADSAGNISSDCVLRTGCFVSNLSALPSKGLDC